MDSLLNGDSSLTKTDILLREMQKVAAKYDFEIGVNWCDGWLYYDWITKLYPENSIPVRQRPNTWLNVINIW